MNHSPVKLVAGLGNPGEKYANTRHNAGFLFLETLCKQLAVSLNIDKQCLGRTAKVNIEGHELRLLAPDTFMNLSGNAVSAAIRYYKIDISEVLVVHDELDLDPGIARFKLGGGHGGNNGLRDVMEKAASNNFARLRVGIGRPAPGRDVSAYVLKPPSNDDRGKIERAICESALLINLVAAGDYAQAMNELHSSLTSSQ